MRPTPDRLREALFNILAPQIEGAIFLDAYAGTGAVGIEALSRGAARVILIERNAKAIEVIRENLSALQISSEVTVSRGNAAVLAPTFEVDIAFIDPPYDLAAEYSESLLAVNCRLAIAQHSSHLQLEEAYGALRRFRVLKQGDNSLSFYQRAEDERP